MVMREIWFHSMRDWPERLTSEFWNVTWSAFTVSKKWHYHCIQIHICGKLGRMVVQYQEADQYMKNGCASLSFMYSTLLFIIYHEHYSDVIMGAISYQITSLTIVYSTVHPDADQRKHQSSVSLAFVRGIHRGPENSLHKGPVMWKMFSFDDIIIGMDVKQVWVTLDIHAGRSFKYTSSICRMGVNSVLTDISPPRVFPFIPSMSQTHFPREMCQ